MFGMKKELKYIKVTGAMVSRGEYSTGSLDMRPYTAVTIVDEQGEKLYFERLTIPKRLDDHIQLNCRMSFVIFRYRTVNGMEGSLLALEAEGQKYLFMREALVLIKSLSHAYSSRVQFIRNTQIFAVSACIGGAMCFGLGFLIGSIFGEFVAGLSGFVAVGFWICFLFSPIIRWKAHAGVPHFEALLSKEGFTAGPVTSDKY